jgi:hypothetical protein
VRFDHKICLFFGLEYRMLLGTGALTRGLSDAMSNIPSATIEFFVTDTSKQLLPNVSYPHVRYRAYDLSRDPEEQGIVPGFDVICAFQVLVGFICCGVSGAQQSRSMLFLLSVRF